jgi:hypothetical protein
MNQNYEKQSVKAKLIALAAAGAAAGVAASAAAGAADGAAADLAAAAAAAAIAVITTATSYKAVKISSCMKTKKKTLFCKI